MDGQVLVNAAQVPATLCSPVSFHDFGSCKVKSRPQGWHTFWQKWPAGFKAATTPEAEHRLLCMGHDDCLSTSCQGADEGATGMLPDIFDEGLSMHLGCSMLKIILAECRVWQFTC